MRAVVALALGLVLLAPVAAAECARIEDLALHRGEYAFVQTRTLKGVKKPLVANGLLRAEPDAVVWTIAQPIEIVTRIGPGGVTQAIDGGAAQPVGPAGSGNPFFQETGLVDLLRGDLSKVDQYYLVTRTKRTKPEGWKLALKPKSEILSKYIASVAVEGCARIESIAIAQSSGDSIRIDLKAGS